MRQERSGSPMGSGPIPRTIVTILVAVMLLFNLAAMILSIEPVTKGVMDDFESRSHGEITLPYIPDEGDLIEWNTSVDPYVGQPFGIEISFPNGSRPYMDHRLILKGGDLELYLPLWHEVPYSDGVMNSYCNGIFDSGQYSVGLERKIFGGTEIVTIGSIQIDPIPGNNCLKYVQPADLLVRSGSISLGLDQENCEDLSSLVYTINDEFNRTISLKNISDRIIIPSDELRPGLNEVRLQAIQNGTSEIILKFMKDIDPLAISKNFDIDVIRVFVGTDELYGQEPQYWLDADDGSSLELFQNEYYKVNLTIPEIDPDYMVMMDLRIQIDRSSYPLFPVDDGVFRGVFLCPSSFDDDGISIVLDHPEGNKTLGLIDVTLRRDRAPIIVLEPDPFDLGHYIDDGEVPVSLLLYAEWADFNRRDFKEDTGATLDGISLEPAEKENIFLHELNFTMDPDEAYSGKVLNISSTTEFRFGTILTFLLPGPRIFYYIPIVLENTAVFVYFFLLVAAIFVSVGILFIQSFIRKRTTTVNERKRSFLFDRIHFLRTGSPLVITAKTYTGAYFFFAMSIFFFQFSSTPTPGLDILSSQTPIWMRMFTLAEASVWEEVSGRVVLIGLPLALVYLMKERKPSSILRIFGGSGYFGNLEVFLIILSGSLFGIAHLGWGPWKVLPTFIHGLMFGYLFVKVGLHATIAMHFLFDYSGFLPEMIGVGNGVQLLFLFTMLVLGGFYIGELVRGTQVWLSDRTSEKVAKPGVLLIAHSIFSLFLAYIFFSSGNGTLLVPFLLFVPIMDIGVFFIFHRRTISSFSQLIDIKEKENISIIEEVLFWIASMMCYIASYITLIGSAFGFGWIVSRRR